jgi:hypothetical protein
MADDPNDTAEYEPVVPRFGAVQPAEVRFGAVPAFADRIAPLPESQWVETDALRPFLPEVRAQKNSNCTNAASSNWLFTMLRAAGYDCPELSWAYNYARNNGGRDQGAMCRDLSMDLLQVGTPRRDLWPDERIYLPRGPIPTEVSADAATRLGLEIYQCLGWADVGTALSLGFGVYHGFVLGIAFIDRTGPDGVVPAWDGRFSNGHAMFSYGLVKVNGTWRTRCRNSWGRGFGQGGDCYIDESYFWSERGQYINLDCYCMRAVKRPAAAG